MGGTGQLCPAMGKKESKDEGHCPFPPCFYFPIVAAVIQGCILDCSIRTHLVIHTLCGGAEGLGVTYSGGHNLHAVARGRIHDLMPANLRLCPELSPSSFSFCLSCFTFSPAPCVAFRREHESLMPRAIRGRNQKLLSLVSTP